MFRNKEKYRMDVRSADSALQNILTQCGQNPQESSGPSSLEELLRQQKAKNRRQRIALAVLTVLLAVCVLAVSAVILRGRGREPLQNPELVSHYVAEGQLHITIDPRGNTVLYSEACLCEPDGTRHAPISYDKKTHTICFPYLGTECNIYIPCQGGAQLHLLLVPQQ